MTSKASILGIATVLVLAGCGSAPEASSEAMSACARTGRPYTGAQPPPGYPDAQRGTGEHSNEWYVPSKTKPGRWGFLCVAK